ncbi:MAG: hypothetical protein CMF74_15740 [Maricaulis sp.]|jgi:hypothetical protein|nr:hypothetical protein [Maricaulis sp.]|tara:strand:+ start:370 stop:783 length:414 start_codon:yes stop_codon:yes gene_type:complete
MKKFLIATAIAGLMAAPAFADGMDNATGNTVRVIIDEAGHGFDAYFDADGSYSDSLGRTGATWSLSDSGELCVNPPEGMMQEDGTPIEPDCGPWNSDLAVGDSWETDGWSDDGSTLTVSIIEGRGHDAPSLPPRPAE